MGNGKNYNAGIDLLKALACLGVVAMHFGHGVKVAPLAVPVFMFVSAYLCGRLFTKGTWCDLFGRIKRLYVPFVIWGLIYYLVYCIIDHNLDVCVLAKQLLVGTPACPVLYFLFLLACYSFILFCVGHMRQKVVVLSLILVSCLVLQYSGVNAAVFNHFHFDFRMVLGRFVELLPAAIIGYGFYLIRQMGVNAKIVTSVFSLIAITVYGMFIGGAFALKCEGFLYQGLPLLLGATGVCVAGVTWMAIGERVGGRIRCIAQLTPGIYYIHLLVGKSLEMVIGRQRGWIETIVVFALSAICVFAMRKIHYVESIVR